MKFEPHAPLLSNCSWHVSGSHTLRGMEALFISASRLFYSIMALSHGKRGLHSSTGSPPRPLGHFTTTDRLLLQITPVVWSSLWFFTPPTSHLSQRLPIPLLLPPFLTVDFGFTVFVAKCQKQVTGSSLVFSVFLPCVTAEPTSSPKPWLTHTNYLCLFLFLCSSDLLLI